MATPSWLRRLRSAIVTHRNSQPRYRTPFHARPHVEFLVDRTLLTASWLTGAGAIGDSYTVPYFNRFGPNTHNWVEALADLRGINFGGLPSQPPQPQQSGYANTWSGPNSYGASQVAAPGLATQIQAGQVNLAVDEVGSHDFIWYPIPNSSPWEQVPPGGLAGSPTVFRDVYQGTLAGASLQTYTDQVLANLGQILDTLSTAGNARVVAFNIADFSTVPAISLLGFTDPAGLARYSQAVAAADAQYQALASQKGIPLLDFDGFSHLVTSGNVVVGGVALDLKHFASPANPIDFFADPQHAGTVAQGLLANMVIEAADNAYGANIAPLSDQEILQYAGITPPTSGPTYFDVSPFIIYPVPTTTRLSTATANVGSPDLALTINGTNFLNSSVVEWNGTALPTTFVNQTTLQTTIPAADLTRAGSFSITVANPTPGGGPSNAQLFTVNPATPAVVVTDADGTYNDQPFPATATVAGVVKSVDDSPGSTLEGIGLTLDYQQLDSNGNVIADLHSQAPVYAGTYKVRASFAGSADYTSTSATTSFTIAKAPSTVSVSDAGGTYDGLPFPATATVAGVVKGVDDSPGSTLEGVGLTLDYQQLDSNGNVIADLHSQAPVYAGTYKVTASFAGSADYTAASASATFTIAQATPTFSVTATTVITDGTPSVTLSGSLGDGSLHPTGCVTVTLDGQSQTVPIGTDGTFSAIFPTASLNVGTHSLGFNYVGDQNFTTATATGTLDDTYGVLALFDQVQARHPGSTLPVKIELATAAGQDVSSGAVSVTALGITPTTDTTDLVGAALSSGSLMPVQSAGGSNPGNVFRYQGGQYPFYLFNLQIPTGLTAGTYRLYISVQNDPLLHWVLFTVS